MTADRFGPFGRAPGRAGLFLDFDGTLADITNDPHGAVPRRGVPELLVALSRRLRRVVVVSGRPLAYLSRLIPAEVDLVGLYGLEWRTDGAAHTLDAAEPWRDVIEELSKRAVAEFGREVVEPKGLSLTLHYRNDPDLEGPMRRWVDDQAERTGVDGRAAKRSFELHPPIPCDKGTAMLERADGLDAVAYMGDDLGDLPAFDGLDRLSADGVAVLRVTVSSPEVPPILVTRADLVVDGPAGCLLYTSPSPRDL